MPKPIVYTNMMMGSFDAADLMPDIHKETMNDQFRNKRFYVSMAMMHVSPYRRSKKKPAYVVVCWNDRCVAVDNFP